MRTTIALLALSLVACGQEEIVLPDGGASTGTSECGSWYPGAGGDAGASIHAIAEGAIFPCLVWESGRQRGVDAYLNVGEVYLQAKHDVVEAKAKAKALVVVVGARNCPACEELIHALAEIKVDLESAGALMVGTCRSDLRDPEVLLNLDEAEEVLVKGDGWPEEWFLTDDRERYLPPQLDSYTPWLIVVGLGDMKVVELSNDAYFESNAEDLVSLVESL